MGDKQRAVYLNTDIVHDPKLNMLEPGERWDYIQCILAAAQLDNPGVWRDVRHVCDTASLYRDEVETLISADLLVRSLDGTVRMPRGQQHWRVGK